MANVLSSSNKNSSNGNSILFHSTFISSIDDISSHYWDTLWPNNYPFTRHAFFKALEQSESTNKENGWQPHHLLIFKKDNKQPIACCPLFLKTNSYGEYVFDWSWADAYQRSGLDYYPKLLNAAPFTPATGPRFGFLANIDSTQKTELLHFILENIQNCLVDINGSSFHCLFPSSINETDLNSLNKEMRLLKREGCQFHWFNADYQDFDDFLIDCVSRKRKMIRKERKKVFNQKIHIEILSAHETTEQDWHTFYGLYHRTYLKRSGRPGYLGKSFFNDLAKTMPDQLLLAKATLDDNFIAGAVYFKDEETLYGRYWGTMQDIDGLHFETCYYQGIEYAIKHKLKRFDPGAQGEHKIQRGFIPTKTCSYHWLAHPDFHYAVADFLEKEKSYNEAYMIDGMNYLPFNENARCLKFVTK